MSGENDHFRELTSFVYSEDRITDEFLQFFKKRILPRLKLTGYKLEQKRKIAAHAIHNLISTGLVGACVADCRRKTAAGIELRIAVWDAIIEAGFAKMRVGSESSGFQTRYRASGKLLAVRKNWELSLLVDLELDRNTELDDPTSHALVVLHTGKVDPITGAPLPAGEKKRPLNLRDEIAKGAQRDQNGNPHPRAVENGLRYFRALEDQIDFINSSNLDHTWKAFSVDPETGKKRCIPVNVCLRCIHVGQFFQGARFYSFSPFSGQSLTQEQRRTMLIDGEHTAELDFSAMAVTLLYGYAHSEPPAGDAYLPAVIMPKFFGFKNAAPEKQSLVRGFLKRATNICINVDSKAKAHSAVSKLLAKSDEREFLRKVIYTTESSNPVDIVQRIVAAHPKLSNLFFKRMGLKLMTLDGTIMKTILLTFAEAGKPVLGIHDSVVCKVSDATFARMAMSEAYRLMTGRKARIHRVY